MATPRSALTGTSNTIKVKDTGRVNQPNLSMANPDTLIFKNEDTANAVTITFLGAGVGIFNQNGTPITTLTINANSDSPSLSPGLNYNLTVNYTVTIASNTFGPYSIQVGSGPLEFVIDASGNSSLPLAEIPDNGTLYFLNQASDSVTINFSPPNAIYLNGQAITSQTVDGNSQGATLEGRGTNKDVTYTVGVTGAPRRGVGDGSGTITCGST